MLHKFTSLFKLNTLPSPSPSHKYKYFSGDWKLCLYCGERATCKDHVLPVSVALSMSSIDWPAEVLLIVPACHRCNSIAGAKIFTTFQSKLEYIQARLRTKLIELTLRQAIAQGELVKCECKPGTWCVRVEGLSGELEE